MLDWARDAPDARYRRVEGTMAFCDISGFTAMSERLAKKGRIGAEELTDVLNTVFAALLERAAEYDGTMLKYGGDAVLVFFTGEGHERRGAAATAAMRKTLRTVGRQRTTAGWVRLRMSVGVHSGEFDFFLVGSTHRELIVAGRAATLTCAMETAANAGEILMSSATASALSPSQLGERLGDAVQLARAPRVPAEQRARQRVSDGDAAAFVPTALREYLLAGGESPEHRLVTIAFIAFGGLDDALARRGGDATAETLQSLIEIATARFEEHGVTFLASDIYGDGGKIIAVAGAPTGYENNEERMLRAVRAIVDEYDDLPLHIGVHRGAVFTGDVGPPFRRTYTMLGDAVNTSARVMANAGTGEVVATPTVLDRSQTLFDLEERAPFEAKGKAEPIATFAVGAISGHRPAFGERLPLVGRGSELAVLRDVLDGVAAGTGAVVELVGEAGIGKTRLVEEFVESATVPALIARCEEYQASTPYFAVRQLLNAAGLNATGLEATVANAAPQFLPWLPLIAGVLGSELQSTPEVDQLAPSAYTSKLHATVTGLFRALLPSAVFVVEDTQWADAASNAYFSALASSVDTDAWLLLLTRRPQDDPPFERDPPVKTLTVGPLSVVDATALARAAATTQLVPSAAHRLAERAGGRPLFVQELARTAHITRDGSLPDTVDSLIASRIDVLEPAARDALRRASVLGVTFPVATLYALAGYVDLASLAEFIEVSHGVGRFRQALFHEAAYAGLPFTKRRELHRDVAAILEGSEPFGTEDLSLHHFEGGNFERAWSYSLQAGERAIGLASHADALTFFKRAVTAGRRSGVPAPTLAVALKDLGRSHWACGELAAARAAYKRARVKAGHDAELLAVLDINEAEVCLGLGKWVAAQRWVRRALELAQRNSVDKRPECRALLLMAGIKLRLGRRDAETWARRGLAAAEAAGLDHERAHAHATLAVAEIQRGHGDGLEHNRAAVELYAALGDRPNQAGVLHNMAYTFHAADDWQAATELYNRAAEAYDGAGMEIHAAITRVNLGELFCDQGRLEESRTALQDAVGVFELTDAYQLPYAVALAGLIQTFLGDAGAGREMLDRATTQLAALGADRELGSAELWSAQAFLVNGDPNGADAAVARAEANEDATTSTQRALLRAWAVAQRGERTRAITMLSDVLAEARAASTGREELLALYALAELRGADDRGDLERQLATKAESMGVVAMPPMPLKQRAPIQ